MPHRSAFMVAQLKCVLRVIRNPVLVEVEVMYVVLPIDLELFAQTNVSYISLYRVLKFLSLV